MQNADAMTATTPHTKSRRVTAPVRVTGQDSAQPVSSERETQHVAIAASLHRALKLRAADQRKTLRELVETYLGELLTH